MTEINSCEAFAQFCTPAAGVQPFAVVCFHSSFSAYSRRTLAALLEIEPLFPFIAFSRVDVDLADFGEVTNKLEIAGLPCVIAVARGHAGALVGRATWMGERSAAKFYELIEAYVSRIN